MSTGLSGGRRGVHSRSEWTTHWHRLAGRLTLGRMGRHKTISDDDVLQVARGVFRAHGHTATTRAIADAAGISEAVLYQRFGSKDELFFSAMHARGPDIEELLGPESPPDDAHEYLRAVVVRLAKYFATVIPLALRVMTHPSFDPRTLARRQPGGPAELHAGLERRLAALVRRQRMATPSVRVTARLLTSLAHDWALGNALAQNATSQSMNHLKKMVDFIWNGLRPRSESC